jgi:hypothetical protein
VIQFVNDLRQVVSFLCHNITEILLKVALNTITLTLKPGTHDDFLRQRWLFFKISRQDVEQETFLFHIYII